jgi:hypothetical protein
MLRCTVHDAHVTLWPAPRPPQGFGPTFGFYLHIDTAETTTTTKYDTLTAQVLNSSGTVLATLATSEDCGRRTARAAVAGLCRGGCALIFGLFPNPFVISAHSGRLPRL